jgi:hypothetical protein
MGFRNSQLFCKNVEKSWHRPQKQQDEPLEMAEKIRLNKSWHQNDIFFLNTFFLISCQPTQLEKRTWGQAHRKQSTCQTHFYFHLFLFRHLGREGLVSFREVARPCKHVTHEKQTVQILTSYNQGLIEVAKFARSTSMDTVRGRFVRADNFTSGSISDGNRTPFSITDKMERMKQFLGRSATPCASTHSRPSFQVIILFLSTTLVTGWPASPCTWRKWPLTS